MGLAGAVEKLDAALCVERIRRGSPEWEEHLARYFQPRIYAYASRALRSGTAVDDVVQEVLWAAIQALRQGNLQNPLLLSPFMYGIARNRTMDYLRTTARRRTDPMPDGFEVPAIPSEAVLEAERAEHAAEVIRGLEPLDREILNLVLVDGLKPAQIAARLALNLDAVRQRKCRALKRVADKIRNSAHSRSQGTGSERPNGMRTNP